MDGLLVVDKPPGPTSHTVVARLRQVLGERRIGHTGTLDPMASGVLPLVIGRATRLARFLSASTKSYHAVVRLGVSTDTYDAQGVPVGAPYTGPLPDRAAVERALERFQGTFLQQPPAYSAKKLGGVRSYKLARGSASVRAGSAAFARGASPPKGPPAPVEKKSAGPVDVTATVTVMRIDADRLTLEIDCSAGFYVRALAHDLGAALGTGAHLAALRRTRAGTLTLEEAVSLESLEGDPDRARSAVLPLARMLPHLASVILTSEGLRRVSHGRELGPAHFSPGAAGGPGAVRLLDPSGNLVGIAETGAAGVLHPAVVLM